MREQFHHATAGSDAAWRAFRNEYFAALDAGGEDVAAALTELDAAMKAGPVTLLYAAKDEERNNAIALREWLERSEEHTSELQSLMRISYAVFCLKKKKPKSKT